MEKEFLKSIHDNQQIIYKVCKMYRDIKEDQEDLFQEIVYQLWKSYPSFRAESKISSWIYKIALNTGMAIYRKPKLIFDYFKKIPDHNHFTYTQETSESEERLFSVLRKLNHADKALISLYLDEFSYQEISKILGISESNVGVRLNRIKRKLK